MVSTDDSATKLSVNSTVVKVWKISGPHPDRDSLRERKDRGLLRTEDTVEKDGNLKLPSSRPFRMRRMDVDSRKSTQTK